MAKMTPGEVAQKWANNLGNAVQYVKAGVDRVTESPMQKAAAQEDKWIQNLQKAKASGKFKRGLLNVSLEAWKEKTRDVGADRIPSGAAAAMEKSAKFYDKLLPFQDKLKGQLKGMPQTTIQDSVARATKWILGMAEFDKTK